ncbi:hypothetical protein GGD62_008407 [Bradyrhizobium sp. ERR14]|nr:hypothetical protein [Bradyrhizobium sp. ERR14]
MGPSAGSSGASSLRASSCHASAVANRPGKAERLSQSDCFWPPRVGCPLSVREMLVISLSAYLDGVWDAAPLETELLNQADRLNS